MDVWPFTEENPKLQAFVRKCQEGCLVEIDRSTVETWLNEMFESNFISRSAYDFDQAYSELIKKVHFDFNAQIFELFKHEYLSRHDETTTFNNICRQMGYKTVPKGRLLEWFEEFYESKNKDEIHPEYR